jgi:phage terminase small subunit
MTRSKKPQSADTSNPIPSETPLKDNLTDKQRAFVNAYIINGFNATQAAKSAGYSDDTAAVIGSENLRKPYIKAQIEALFAEHSMSAKEVIARLTDHARGDLGDFLDEETGAVNWSKAKGKTALIKRIKRKTETTRDKDGVETITLDEELELHSPQFALQLLGKHQGILADKQEHTGDIAIRLVRETNFNPQPTISESDE